MSDIDELKRANQARLMAQPDYHPRVRDDHPLAMVRCPFTGKSARGEVWISMTEKRPDGSGRSMCAQCDTEDERAAILASRDAFLADRKGRHRTR